MNRFNRRIVAALLGGLGLFASPAFAQNGALVPGRSLPPPSQSLLKTPLEWVLDGDGMYRMTLSFALEFAADGRPTLLEPLPGQHPQAVAGVLPQLAQLRFAAHDSEHRSVPAKTTLRVYMEGVPRADGKFEMSVSGMDTGPRVTRGPAPKYPLRALRQLQQGSTMVDVLVGSDGKPRQFKIAKGLPRNDFARAALASIKEWRFLPDRIGDESIETWVRVPFVFSIPGRRPPMPVWQKQVGTPDAALTALDSPIRFAAPGS